MVRGVSPWPLPAEVQGLGRVFSEYFHFFLATVTCPVFHTHSLYNHSQQHYEIEQTQLTLVLSENKIDQQESGIQKKFITLMIGSNSIFL